jgi:lysine/ornithine N-monooxygenase
MQSWALKLYYFLNGNQFQIYFGNELAILLKPDSPMKFLNFIQVLWKIIRFEEGDYKGQ